MHGLNLLENENNSYSGDDLEEIDDSNSSKQK